MKACEKPRSVMGRSMALAAFLSVAAAVATSVCADDIPFWGCDPSATNRSAAAVASSGTTSDFDSRVSSFAEFFLDDFTTMPVGVILIVR